MLQGGLECNAVDFFQPNGFFFLFHLREHGGTSVIGQAFAGFRIGRVPELQKMIKDKSRTTDGFTDQDSLFLIGIETELIGFVSEHWIHLLLFHYTPILFQRTKRPRRFIPRLKSRVFSAH